MFSFAFISVSFRYKLCFENAIVIVKLYRCKKTHLKKFKKLRKSLVEKIVQNVIKRALNNYFNAVIAFTKYLLGFSGVTPYVFSQSKTESFKIIEAISSQKM